MYLVSLIFITSTTNKFCERIQYLWNITVIM